MKNRFSVVLVVALAMITGAFAGLQWSPKYRGGPLIEGVAQAVVTAPNAPAPLPEAALLKKSSESFRAVAKMVGPAVVTVKSTQAAVRPRRLGIPQGPGRRMPQGPQGENSPFSDPFFDLFRQFGQPMPPQGQAPKTGLGSGFIVDKRGYIVTNNHVVEGANKVTIMMPDDEATEIPARVVGTDPKSDLAVLKFEPKKPLTTVAEWADAESIEVGDWAIAIGSPFMLTHSVTAGIVSAKGRNSSTLLGSKFGIDMLQTDAAINPGNSGGPLCAIDGKVMGVNTAIFTQSGGYMGIGFAIPSSVAKAVVDSLIKDGKVVRGWLGVAIQPVDETMASELGIKGGALIHSVEPGSPAQQAGLKPGDLVTEVGGKPVKDTSQLQLLVSAYPPGQKVKLKVVNYNDRKTRTPEVKIGEMKAEKAQLSESDQPGGPDKLGLEVAPSDQGVAVQNVAPGSAGEMAGLQPGDVIQSINRKRVDSLDTYQNQVKSGKPLNLAVRRGEQDLFVQITPPQG